MASSNWESGKSVCPTSQNVKTHYSPEEMAEEDVKATSETFKEIKEIRENVREQAAAAEGRMIQNRNEGNREWMQLNEEGQKTRQLDFIETEAALLNLQEGSEEFLASQAKELERYKAEHERKQQVQKLKADEELAQMESQSARDMDVMKVNTSSQVSQLYQGLSQEKAETDEVLTQIRRSALDERRRNEQRQSVELQRIQRQTRERIAELEKKAREAEEQAKKQKSGLTKLFQNSMGYIFGQNSNNSIPSQTGTSITLRENLPKTNSYSQSSRGYDYDYASTSNSGRDEIRVTNPQYPRNNDATSLSTYANSGHDSRTVSSQGYGMAYGQNYGECFSSSITDPATATITNEGGVSPSESRDKAKKVSKK